MNPVTPGARWSPQIHARRPVMGQARADILTVTVKKDGSPLAGVALEVLFMDGESKTGVTDGAGQFAVPYFPSRTTLQATVLITPPEGVEDLGEGVAQSVELKGGPAAVQFDLVGIGESSLVGLGIAGLLYGLVLGVV